MRQARPPRHRVWNPERGRPIDANPVRSASAASAVRLAISAASISCCGGAQTPAIFAYTLAQGLVSQHSSGFWSTKRRPGGRSRIRWTDSRSMKSVILPPGWARLSTKPAPTGVEPQEAPTSVALTCRVEEPSTASISDITRWEFPTDLSYQRRFQQRHLERWVIRRWVAEVPLPQAPPPTALQNASAAPPWIVAKEQQSTPSLMPGSLYRRLAHNPSCDNVEPTAFW